MRALLAANPEAFLLGILDAVDTGAVHPLRVAPFGDYFETDLLQRYHASDPLVRAAQRRDAVARAEPAPEAPATDEEFVPITLVGLLADGGKAAIAQLKHEAIQLESEAAELSDEAKDQLRELLERSWPSDGISAAVVKLDEGGWRVTPDALAILFYGPHVDLPLSAPRWADVAASTYLFTPQLEWLERHWSMEALELLLSQAAIKTASGWDVVVSATPDPVPGSLANAVAERLRVVDEQGALRHIIDRLRSSRRTGALRRVAELHADAESEVRRALAALGDVEAQGVLLAGLLEDLENTEGIDGDYLDWIAGIEDPVLLPHLFAALPAAYNHRPGPLGVNTTMTVLHDAIRRLGGLAAVEGYDELLARDPRPWEGAQFVRIHRDEVLDDVLDAQAAAREEAFRIALGL